MAKDNVVSKVGQLIYRFSAVYGQSPNVVMLGVSEILELKEMIGVKTATEVSEFWSRDQLRGLPIMRIPVESMCRVALLGHED